MELLTTIYQFNNEFQNLFKATWLGATVAAIISDQTFQVSLKFCYKRLQ